MSVVTQLEMYFNASGACRPLSRNRRYTGTGSPFLKLSMIMYSIARLSLVAFEPSRTSANEAGAAGQEERQLGEQNQDEQTDEQRDQVRPVRLEVAPDGNIRETQGHEEPDADRRQEETDPDGGGEHGREVDGMDADLLGDREHDRNEHHRGRQPLEHHAEEHHEHRHRDQEKPRRAIEGLQELAE